MTNEIPELIEFPYDDIDPTPVEGESLRAWTIRLVSHMQQGKPIVIGHGNIPSFRNYITTVSHMTGRSFQTVKVPRGLKVFRKL